MQNLPIAITATFTAEPVRGALELLLEELKFSPSVAFAQFNQVFQQLLDPNSLLATNRQGVNVVLVRFEDWAGDSFSQAAQENVERSVRDLVAGLEPAARRAGTPYVICVCPLSLAAAADQDFASFSARMERYLADELKPFENVSLLTGDQIRQAYPVAGYDDAHGDKLGHMPYTPSFYSAIGMMLARRIYRIKSARHKVIVLDCDQTLWKGTVGEDGAQGIEIDAPHRFLQEFMLAQHKAGMILCLCSKNNEKDALRVFESRADMTLRLEHILAWRINWQPKSENMRALAAELNLGIDSFIFVDDDPVVCAEVQANCPEVLTVQLPSDLDNIPSALKNVWAFDYLKVTKEDEKRTGLYKQNVERERVRRENPTFEAFLESLGLKVRIAAVQPHELARVSQLTFRTNQFNCTTIRRQEADIEQLAAAGSDCFVVEASDRFGDYGLIGVMIFKPAGTALEVDTLLMSCRALGRGIEHRMIALLGKIAEERHLGKVVLRYVSTPKNQPALEFLNFLGMEFRAEIEGGYLYSIPSDVAANTIFKPPAGAAPAPVSENDSPKSQSPATGGDSAAWTRIANELNTPERVLQRVEAAKRRDPVRTANVVAARNSFEQQLLDIWTEALGIGGIGVTDNFFDLGGDSLMAVCVFSEIEKKFGKPLSMAMLFDTPTVAGLADVLRREGWDASWSSLVPIQPNGSKPTLYCMHAAGGNVLFYGDLSRYLGPAQPLYGLQAQGMDRKRPRHNRVEDMAEHYIKEIRAFQPEGPYYLAGSSFGGLLAFEMARRLEQRGQKIAFLGLFDTYGPGYPKYTSPPSSLRLKFNRLVHRVHHHLSAIRELGSRRWSYIGEKAAKARRLMRRNYRNRKNEIARAFVQATGRELPRSLEKAQNAILEALKVYVPKEYGGRITLFRASHQPRGVVPDPHLGWTAMALGGIDVYEVPGFHGAVTAEPHVPFLAERLKTCLEECHTQTSGSRAAALR